MKLLDSFFSRIIKMGVYLENIERLYLQKRKFILGLFFSCILLAVILMKYEQIIICSVVMELGIAIIAYDSILGWRHSVRKLFKVCLVSNVFFSVMLACTICEFIKISAITPIFIVLYLVVWVFLSLMADIEVAMLVNEIISGIVTTIFTIGTFLISMELKKLPSAKEYLTYFQSEDLFEQALESGDKVALRFFKADFLELLESGCLAFLPIIGITGVCIIAVKVKDYWMKKRDKTCLN